MVGGWGRGGDSSRPTDNKEGGGLLEDPFDQQAATDAPAEWQGGGAWDEEARLETGASDSGFGQEADGSGMIDGARPRPPIAYPGGPQQMEGPPRVDAAEVRRRLGMGVCAIEAVVHGVQGAVIGSIFGVFGGVSEGMSAGARGKPLVQHVLLRARGSALSFGSWIGMYQGSKCSMVVARGGKKDAFNAFAAGFAAGAVPALPTRNPRVILFSALGSAGLMGSIEAAASFFGGGVGH